jgi:outer membrane protein OmpA-like peptidoglycan-associated protein
MGSLSLRAVAPALICAGMALSGCQSGPGASVTADDPGFQALGSGDYQKARDEFEAENTKTPHDPYVELDLAVAYQQLGRMDLAEALYRQAMVDGKDVYPSVTTFDRDKGKSIADIGCENISIGFKSDNCNVAPPAPPLPPPPVKNFIVFFDFNKTNLTAEAQSVIAQAVQTAKSTGAVRILVTGHTDTVGSDRYNQRLSMRRAEVVKEAMVSGGIDGSAISIEGKGFHDPLVPTGPGVREPQNRRAVIDLGGGGPSS